MVPQKELCLKKRGQLNIRKRGALFCSENLEPPILSFLYLSPLPLSVPQLACFFPSLPLPLPFTPSACPLPSSCLAFRPPFSYPPCLQRTNSFLEMLDNGTKQQLTCCSENYEWMTRKRLRWGTDRDYGTFNLSIACLDSPGEMISSCSAN